MAGCSVVHEGAGDPHAAEGRVLGWVWGGAALGAIAGFLSAAGVVTGGPIGLLGALVILGIVVFTAVGLAIVGFFVGFAVNWFDRLFAHNPSNITMAGCILCAGKNTGFPPWNDNDWTFNLGGRSLSLLAPTDAGLSVDEIRTRDAPGGGPAFPVLDPSTRQPALHCEIGSHIGDYAAVGGAVGSVAGAIGGAIAGAAICVALGLATLGIGALACLLVVAIAIAVGAAAGGLAGDAIGAGIGWIADELDDFDERGEAITRGCLMILNGRWVTDSSHQWNEIHDIESAQLVECPDPPCEADVGRSGAPLIAAVGIGRHPTGRDP